MIENIVTIFTDGSSRGNPGPGGFGFVVAYQSHGTMKIDEGGGREDLTTNNRMEMQAAIGALSHLDGYFAPAEMKEKIFRVHCDSSYVINGITKWVFGWEKNNWKTSLKEDVINEDLWKKLREVTLHKKIEWIVVKGHSGIRGNERCDVIATAYADGKVPELFTGNLSDYSIDIMNISQDASTSSAKKKSSKGKAYSYVSMVDGLVMIHPTWEECEKRVKGAKGAKFKKVTSAQEEGDYIKSLKNL